MNNLTDEECVKLYFQTINNLGIPFGEKLFDPKKPGEPLDPNNFGYLRMDIINHIAMFVRALRK